MGRVRNNEVGTAALETALSISLFLVVLLIGLDLLLFVSTSSRLQYSMAASARWGSLGKVLEDPVSGTVLSRSDSIKLYASQTAIGLGLQLSPANLVVCPQGRPQCVQGQDSAGDPGEFFFIRCGFNYSFLFGRFNSLIQIEVTGRNEPYA